ncbi:MAG: VOC family protein [Paracoccaceae bacterium]
MKLGAFSISLTVKDLAASKAFYEQLGFTTTGNVKDMWLIMKNQNTIVGLFQGMFDKNMLTFNPGWDQDAQHVEGFTDIRSIQKRLKADGVTIENEADETTSGPASFIVIDPDGNPLLFDQHV